MEGGGKGAKEGGATMEGGGRGLVVAENQQP